MDHLTSEWPGTKNLKGCANFDMEHRKWEKSLFVAFRPIAKILDYYEGHTIWKLSSSAYRKCHGFLCYFSKNIFIFNPTLSCNNVSFHMAYPGYLRKFLEKRKTFAFALFSSILDLFHRKSMGNQWSWTFELFHWIFCMISHCNALFVTDIHQIMLISLFLTSFDHFHFHPFSVLISRH